MGEGIFAVVKTCQDKYYGRYCILKTIGKAKVFGQEDLVTRELEIAKMLRHEYLVQVLDSWETCDEDCLVMEAIHVSILY